MTVLTHDKIYWNEIKVEIELIKRIVNIIKFVNRFDETFDRFNDICDKVDEFEFVRTFQIMMIIMTVLELDTDNEWKSNVIQFWLSKNLKF